MPKVLFAKGDGDRERVGQLVAHHPQGVAHPGGVGGGIEAGGRERQLLVDGGRAIALGHHALHQGAVEVDEHGLIGLGTFPGFGERSGSLGGWHQAIAAPFPLAGGGVDREHLAKFGFDKEGEGLAVVAWG